MNLSATEEVTETPGIDSKAFEILLLQEIAFSPLAFKPFPVRGWWGSRGRKGARPGRSVRFVGSLGGSRVRGRVEREGLGALGDRLSQVRRLQGRPRPGPSPVSGASKR